MKNVIFNRSEGGFNKKNVEKQRRMSYNLYKFMQTAHRDRVITDRTRKRAP